MGTECTFWGDENVLELIRGAGYTMNELHAAKLYTF